MSKFEVWKAARQLYLDKLREAHTAMEAAALAENARNEAWVALSIAASDLSAADQAKAIEFEYGTKPITQRERLSGSGADMINSMTAEQFDQDRTDEKALVGKSKSAISQE